MSHTYVVGLPVAIEVHPDGSVTFEVDLSEAAEAMDEDDAAMTDEQGNPLYTGPEIDTDILHVEAAIARLGSTISTTTPGGTS